MGIPRLEKGRPIFDRPALSVTLLVTLLVLTAFAAAACTARADVGETIIQRCTHGQSLSGFSQSAYRRALHELSADAEEYSDCSALIRQAQLAAASGKDGASDAQSAAAPVAIAASPSEQAAIVHAARGSTAPLKIDGETIHPGVVHASVASAFSSLPTPLLVTLAFLLACVLPLVGGKLRNRVRRVGRPD